MSLVVTTTSGQMKLAHARREVPIVSLHWLHGSGVVEMIALLAR